MSAIIKWKILCLAFRFVCTLVTIVMIGYWIYKFQKNEDVSTIEYKYVDESKDLRIPEVTICLGMPFIKEKLRELNVPTEKYYRYLKGDKGIEQNYGNIDFKDVTIDIRDHIQQIQLEENSIDGLNNCKTTNTCRSFKWNNNFNGFWDQTFGRCYGLEMVQRSSNNVKRFSISFKPELVNLLLQSKSIHLGGAFLIFNYPQQLLRNAENLHVIWDSETEIKGIAMFRITTMEVIIRRNRQSSPCFTGWKHFDNSVYEKYAGEATCTTPYQEKNKPACNTSKEIADSKYDINEVRNKYFPHSRDQYQTLLQDMYQMFI